MTALERLLSRQAAELARLQDREAAALLRALEDARREILEALTAQTSPALLARQAQVEAALNQMRRRLSAALGAGVTASQEAALAQLLETLAAFEPGLKSPAIELDALSRIAAVENTLTWQHSLDRYGADAAREVQQALLTGTLQGLDAAAIARRIAGASGSVLSGMRGRAELIARMELSRAHDAAFQASMEATEDAIGETGDPLQVRADETLDKKNHPLSRVLDGRIRPVRGPWRVPAALVAVEAARLKRDLRGILWPLIGGEYVGATYPAHFHDRGRGTPWRAAWSR